MKNVIQNHGDVEKLLRDKCGAEGFKKLEELNNRIVSEFIAKYIDHCNPDSVFVRANDEEDADYVRKRSIELGEEHQLKKEGHTVHFDGFHDQARDKDNTKFLLPPDETLNSYFNSINKDEGLEEVHQYLENIMEGKEAYVCFYCLGPRDSPFAIPVLQITDSTYVAHSEDILYRDGYHLFKNSRINKEEDFFKFVHSAGILEDGVSKERDKRRVYTDLEANTVFSTNTQYGGNTIGAKKLAMRLAINKCSEEGWLTEHMFIMGIKGPKYRTSYFSGAYPSGCGKTSTSMVPEESLVGDDIAYLREIDGELRAANPEKGIFGIIRDVNPQDDPLIWKAITTPGEVIFSNILVNNGIPYWLGMDKDLPDSGRNHSGKWWREKHDSEGDPIKPAHRNARYTLRISDLENEDPKLENEEGVKIDGIIYGGRDSDTWVPVEEAFNWEHGILTKGALLESETTSATLEGRGIRRFNPMSNLDFLSIPIGDYIKNQLEFGRKLGTKPPIFSVNYFLKNKEGKYLSSIHDKKIWLKWMELRTHGDVDAIKAPTGYIPYYRDLKDLFEGYLEREYSTETYSEQFRIRIPEHLSKISRMRKIYREKVTNVPEVLYRQLDEQKKRLQDAREKLGDYILPQEFEE